MKKMMVTLLMMGTLMTSHLSASFWDTCTAEAKALLTLTLINSTAPLVVFGVTAYRDWKEDKHNKKKENNFDCFVSALGYGFIGAVLLRTFLHNKHKQSWVNLDLHLITG